MIAFLETAYSTSNQSTGLGLDKTKTPGFNSKVTGHCEVPERLTM